MTSALIILGLTVLRLGIPVLVLLSLGTLLNRREQPFAR
jgi:hypothetical protein